MSWWEDFKKFALKGNMLDLAIAVVIGAAFGKVVNSFVSDVMMPPLGFLIGGVDFNSLAIKLSVPGIHQAPVEIRYGAFISSLIDFLIISGAVFLALKAIMKMRKASPAEEAQTKDCPECCSPIPLKAKKCPHCCSTL